MVTFPKSVYTLSEYIVLESWGGNLAVLFQFPALADNIGIQEFSTIVLYFLGHLALLFCSFVFYLSLNNT